MPATRLWKATRTPTAASSTALGGLRLRELTTGRAGPLPQDRGRRSPGDSPPCQNHPLRNAWAGRPPRRPQQQPCPARSPRSGHQERRSCADRGRRAKAAAGDQEVAGSGQSGRPGHRTAGCRGHLPGHRSQVGKVLAHAGRTWISIRSSPSLTISRNSHQGKRTRYGPPAPPQDSRGIPDRGAPRFAARTCPACSRRNSLPQTAWSFRPQQAPCAARTISRRQWRNARDGTGYEWVTPHVFRKTVATLISREYGSKHAAAQLGHSGSAITEKHYIAKAAVAELTTALDRLGAPEPAALPSAGRDRPARLPGPGL